MVSVEGGKRRRPRQDQRVRMEEIQHDRSSGIAKTDVRDEIYVAADPGKVGP